MADHGRMDEYATKKGPTIKSEIPMAGLARRQPTTSRHASFDNELGPFIE